MHFTQLSPSWFLTGLLGIAGVPSALAAQQAPPDQREQNLRGVLVAEDDATPGYTLIAPLRSAFTYLVDDAGREVHRWQAQLPPGQTAELQPDGHLLRSARSADNARFGGGGEGGRLQEFDWSGELLWDLSLSSEERLAHHDFEVLPNGNVLVIVWEHVDAAAAEARGRYPGSVPEGGLWPDALLELKPLRPDGCEVVWEWHAWDHLVQDVDASLPGYGSVAEHPERIDVNRGAPEALRPESEQERRERRELEQHLRSLGYAGGDGAAGGGDGKGDDAGPDDRQGSRRGSDWMHTNSVDHDPELDLIVISLREWSEVWVIDHSTTSEQARGSSGGRHGRGGDLLWRWGNPANHAQVGGGSAQRRLFGQHDARWTRDGEHVALSIFNNGDGRAERYSTVELVHVPLVDGRFVQPVDGRLVPVEAAWTYRAAPPESFHSGHISGAQPLRNGRVLICEGESGRVFEVDRAGRTLWEFVSTFDGELEGGGPRGGGGRRGPPRGGRPEGAPPGARRGGPPGGPPDGRRAGGPGGMSANALFRAQRIAPDDPSLAGLADRAVGEKR